MQDNLIYYGTHGTIVSRSKIIEKEGFKSFGNPGYRGSGTYFWCGNDERACHLAYASYLDSEKDGKYNKRSDANRNCAIILANLNLNEDNEVLDIDNSEAVNHICKLSEQRGIDTSNKKDISAIYDMYINKIEKNTGLSLKLIRVRVHPPRNISFNIYPTRLLGHPFACIARDNSIINITEVKEYYHE